jgi:peptidyl-tRNA hydrolase
MSSETSTPIASRADFHDAVRAALAQAAATGAAEVCLVDPHFDDWPLNERGVVASLEQWASSRRKLIVIAHSFDELARRASRFVEWRRNWSHVAQCRTVDEIEADQVPTLLFVPGLVSVRLLDRVRYRGVVSGHATDLVECRETIDALLQRSTEGFPATTLGL